jgi:hypothetical protein
VYGGSISSRNASRWLVALFGLVFGTEVASAYLFPHAGWIPKVQVALAVAYLVLVGVIARHRIPTAVRKQHSVFSLTVSCICANHFRCHEHLACPCACHDHHIKRMMAWPAPVPESVGMRNP